VDDLVLIDEIEDDLIKGLMSALTQLVGRQEGHRPVKTDWWDAGVVIWLGQGADLHMAQLVALPLTISCSSKPRLVLPSWFHLSGASSTGQAWTIPKKAIKQLSACMCVCVCKRIT